VHHVLQELLLRGVSPELEPRLHYWALRFRSCSAMVFMTLNSGMRCAGTGFTNATDSLASASSMAF